MGAEAWHYFTPHTADVGQSLQELREREFAARRFYHGERPSATIAEAVEAAGASGTRSVLDIEGLSDRPKFLRACPVPPEILREAFGSEQPDRAAVERGWSEGEAFEDWFVELERASACYVVVYARGQPSEVFFAGWSAD